MSVATEPQFISVASLGEVRKGIEILRRKAPDQCRAFEAWLERLKSRAEYQILPITEEIADRWGVMMARQTLPAIDSWIAATALEHDLILATRNLADFQAAGVEMVNPFDP